MKPLPLLLIALGAATSGCQTLIRRGPANTAPLATAHTSATRAWELVEDGRVAGVVVEFAEEHGPRHFFSVRNEQQQELGMVDELGRAWRYLPYSDEPEWLGTGTVLEGARLVLGLRPDAEAFEVELAVLLHAQAASPVD